jgi:zinc protease
MKYSIIKLGALGVASMLLAINAGAADVEINFTEYTLDNGLRLVVHEDNKAPIVAINVWYHVGSKNEKRGKTGFAHLFEHLMFNGTENYDDEYFKPFELGYGAVDGVRAHGPPAGCYHPGKTG